MIETPILIVLFVLFLFILKKIVSVFFNILKVVFVSALFPVLLKYIGYGITLDISTFLFWINTGLLIYIIYLILKAIFGVGKTFKVFS